MKTVNRKLLVVTQQTQQINEIHLQQFNKKKVRFKPKDFNGVAMNKGQSFHCPLVAILTRVENEMASVMRKKPVMVSNLQL